MSKGIVMSLERNRAVIFTDDCRLVRVPLEPHHAVGKEIFMNQKEAPRAAVRTPSRLRPLRFAAAAALAIAVALGVLFAPGVLPAPVYASISIDVNPSLELQLNRELRVVAALAMNEDAKQILEGLALKGLPWTDAVARWIEAIRTKTTLQVQEMLVSAVLPEDAVALRTQLLAMEGTAAEGTLAGIQVRAIYSNDLAVATQAAQNGLSVGRQMLLTQSELQEQTWTRATIGGASLGDLVGTLLRTQERDMTRYTLHEATGTPAGQKATPGYQDVTPGAGPTNGNGDDVTPGAGPTNGSGGGDVTPGAGSGSGSGSGTGGSGTVTPSCTPDCTPTGSQTQYQGGR